MTTMASLITVIATFYVVMHLGLQTHGTSVISLPTNDHYLALKDDIMNRPAVKHKIPLDVSNDKIINISFTPFQIRYVDEIQQIVGVASLTILLWQFKDLHWNPDDYNGHALLEIDKDMVWTPTITTPKQRSDGFLILPETLKLTPDFVIAEIPYVMETLCDLDLSNFPFDIHNCTIPFIEMNSYNLTPTDFVKTSVKLEDFFGTNTEWMFLDSSCGIQESEDKTFSYCECWVTLQRVDTFYVANILIPLLLMAAMTLCVFCIPADSGEKISFIVSLFVSMAVFVNFVVDNIPRGMAQIPRLVYLILAMMIKLILVTLASAVVLRRYHAQQREENERKELNVLETENKKGRFLESATANDIYIYPERRVSMPDCDKDKNGKESPILRNENLCVSDLGKLFPIKFNKADSENDSTNTKRYLLQKHRPNVVDPLKQSSQISKNSKHNKSEKIIRKISHSQLDKFFFLIFFTVSTTVYACIIFL